MPSGEVARQPGRGVHRHRERHLVGPVDQRGIPRVDRHVDRPHLVALCPQMSRRAPDRARLLPELVGRDQEDLHVISPSAISMARYACAARRDALDLFRRVAAGEQEPKVAVAFGERHDLPTARDGDLETGDARGPHAPRPDRRTSRSVPGVRDGQHHHARRAGFAFEPVERQAERVTQHQLFERDPGAEPATCARTSHRSSAPRPR